jgi:ATP-dependent Clp protease ATP-binding subunit ClpB
VIFRPLDKTSLTTIFNHQLAIFLNIWKENEAVQLPKFSKKQVAEIIEKIYDPQYGARPIERYIQNDIEGELIKEVLNGK